jgi:hypothetical protein
MKKRDGGTGISPVHGARRAEEEMTKYQSQRQNQRRRAGRPPYA